MNKITDMLFRNRMRITQRPRLRTSNKLAVALGVTSVLSITVLMVVYFNLTKVEDTSAIGTGSIIINGRAEIHEMKLSTDFEVKNFDDKNAAFQNDTLIMYKKMLPE